MRVRVQVEAEAEQFHAQLVPVDLWAPVSRLKSLVQRWVEGDQVVGEPGLRSWAAWVGVHAAVT
ncbi:hypothetical protein GCM10010215_67480 [Streptomyces virginiae]|uniref:Uncharacterized protein n=1 Tax=Streptomyces virginiae TaxID=1961 RepID=A0ABQ3NMU4_STRVG|nr:hypothetical protein GCM10010215_67480 [Streptomyces virginiae]GHI14090.1 hypothetical protein Scinn_35530 [Streptomyces virginiae]